MMKENKKQHPNRQFIPLAAGLQGNCMYGIVLSANGKTKEIREDKV